MSDNTGPDVRPDAWPPDSSDYDDLTDREMAHEVLDGEELAATYKARGWRWR